MCRIWLIHQRGVGPHGFDAGPCLARPSRSPQASGSLIQVLAELLLCAGLPEEVGQDAACQPLHRTRFRGRLGCDRLSSTSIRYGFRGSDRRLVPAGACGRIDWDRRGSKQQLVCTAVPLTQRAVRRRNGKRHPLVVSLHFDRKRRSGSVRHALLSFARVRMNRHGMWGAVIEPVRRRCGTKKGRFRSCVSWLGGPGRETALWGRSCHAGPSTGPAHERPAAVPAVSTTS